MPRPRRVRTDSTRRVPLKILRHHTNYIGLIRVYEAGGHGIKASDYNRWVREKKALEAKYPELLGVFWAGRKNPASRGRDPLGYASHPHDPPGYAKRVRALEAEGLTTSDAQGVADVELRGRLVAGKKKPAAGAAANLNLQHFERWNRGGKHKWITKAIAAKLPRIGTTSALPPEKVQIAFKLFNPGGAGSWFITEANLETGEAFGYVTGLGTDELGYMDLNEMRAFKGRFGLPLERDEHLGPLSLAAVMAGVKANPSKPGRYAGPVSARLIFDKYNAAMQTIDEHRKTTPQGSAATKAANAEMLRRMSVRKKNSAAHRVPVKRRDLEAAVELFHKFREEPPKRVRQVRFKVPAMCVVVGELDFVGYTTTHAKKRVRYRHDFSRTARPLLCASADGRQLLIFGGNYDFTRDGIVDRA